MLTMNQVREIFLSFPEVEERLHFDKPSLRVRNKIIATLHVEQGRVVLKLTQEDMEALTGGQPEVFSATAWAHQGWTYVELEYVDPELFRNLAEDSWRRIAPKRLVKGYDLGRDTS